MKIEPKRPFTLEEFNSIYSKVPRICVEIILKNPEGILLTKRAIEPALGKWHLPGGTVLLGETLEETAKRVALEELGIEIKIIKQLGIAEYVKSDNTTGGNAFGVIFLVEQNLKHELIELNDQSNEHNFFTKVPDNTVEEHKLFFEKYKSAIFSK